MNTRYFRIGLAAVAAIGAIAAWFLSRSAESVEGEALALATRARAVRAEQERLVSRLQAARTSWEKLQAEAPTGAVQPIASKKPETSPSGGKPGFLELIRRDPRVQNLYLAYQRNGVAIEYGPLLHELNLDPERIAQFIENVMRQREAAIDVRAAAAAKGLADNVEEIETLQRQQTEAYQQAQRTLLGDDGYRRFATYEDTKFSRLMVTGIAGEAVVAGVGFSNDQLRQLAGVVADASKNQNQSDAHRWMTTDWSYVDEHARNFLSPEQVRFIQSHEALGPMGAGWRHQGALNDLITHGYDEDHSPKKS